jgi:pimeloyl-ACP methyl ester carboxylesterase
MRRPLPEDPEVGGTSQPKLASGVFTNGIPFTRFGEGAKVMLFLAGGPGNTVPSGFGASGFVRGMRAFTDEYTIVLVTRKSGLPAGYTTADMAEDYAQLIRSEFAGHVDLVMGTSYGGLIAQYLAARHPEQFDRLVIVMSGPVVSDEAKRIDLRYAELIGARRDREAMALRAEAVFTGVARSLMAAVLWLFGPPLLGKIDDTFRSDVVVEANAESEHDSRGVLADIAVPTLVVGSSDDCAFPAGTVEEMARAIPGAELKMYPGGHTAAFLDKRFYPDVRRFTDRARQAK